MHQQCIIALRINLLKIIDIFATVMKKSFFAMEYWPDEFSPRWVAYKITPENYGQNGCNTFTRQKAKLSTSLKFIIIYHFKQADFSKNISARITVMPIFVNQIC